MIRLLLVEDDENLRFVIEDGLQHGIGGYEIWVASNGKEGIKLWEEHRPDVILTDVDMPKMNGFQMVEYIRERDLEVSILFISGFRSSVDVTTGYKLGANNYIKKPFTPEELNAHIQALIKMKAAAQAKSETSLQKIGNFTLDAKHAMLRIESCETITLTPLESKVLQELCANKNEIVDRKTILQKYWHTEGLDYFASRSLDVLISKVRKKLAADPNVKIQVAKGMGIMLVDQPPFQDPDPEEDE